MFCEAPANLSQNLRQTSLLYRNGERLILSMLGNLRQCSMESGSNLTHGSDHYRTDPKTPSVFAPQTCASHEGNKAQTNSATLGDDNNLLSATVSSEIHSPRPLPTQMKQNVTWPEAPDITEHTSNTTVVNNARNSLTYVEQRLYRKRRGFPYSLAMSTSSTCGKPHRALEEIALIHTNAFQFAVVADGKEHHAFVIDTNSESVREIKTDLVDEDDDIQQANMFCESYSRRDRTAVTMAITKVKHPANAKNDAVDDVDMPHFTMSCESRGRMNSVPNAPSRAVAKAGIGAMNKNAEVQKGVLCEDYIPEVIVAVV